MSRTVARISGKGFDMAFDIVYYSLHPHRPGNHATNREDLPT